MKLLARIPSVENVALHLLLLSQSASGQVHETIERVLHQLVETEGAVPWHLHRNVLLHHFVVALDLQAPQTLAIDWLKVRYKAVAGCSRGVCSRRIGTSRQIG